MGGSIAARENRDLDFRASFSASGGMVAAEAVA